MKNSFLFLLGLIIILSSCNVSNDVVDSKIISKRKYLKGYHLKTNKLAKSEFKKKNTSENNKKELISKITGVPQSVVWLEANTKKEIEVPENLSNSQPLEITLHQNTKNNILKEKKVNKKDLKKALKPKLIEESGNGDTAALLGLIFGSLGLLLSLIGAGILFAIAGLVLSIIGLKSENDKKLAKLGLIFSIVAIVLFFVWVTFIVLFGFLI